MSIKFDGLDLLELFENEPKILFEPDTRVYIYEKCDSRNYTLCLYLSAYEETVILTLTHKNLKYPIFDLKLDNVTKIKKADNKLVIQRKNNIESVVVYFAPNYFLRTE